MAKINTAPGDLVVPVIAADPTEVGADGLGSGELEPVDQGPDKVLARRSERGMVSAEWTVGIIAAVAIAGVLLAVVTSGGVKGILTDVIVEIITSFTKGL